jgi:putative copper resistance protein D
MSVLDSWTFAPFTDALVVAATAAYTALVHRLRAQPASRWPRRCSAAWVAGAGALVIAVNSPVAAYGQELLWVHMVAHLLLIMVVPVLAVWARPITLLRDGCGPRGRRVLDGVLRSRPLRILTFPLTALMTYTSVIVLTHLTGFQQTAAGDTALRGLEIASYLASGYLLFWPLAGSEAAPWQVPYPLRFLVLGLAMGPDTLTGVALMMTSAPPYAPWHPGQLPVAPGDQHGAGAIMWGGGDGLMMILMIIVAVRWGLAAQERQDLGPWMEHARRRALLGDGPDDVRDAVDEDPRALDAYNAMLASLAGRPRSRAAQDRNTERATPSGPPRRQSNQHHNTLAAMPPDTGKETTGDP